ncbi:3'-5' exonuclease DinG [Asticcacaulis sp. MM231]|uniref:exonuclease domain-containing protein n=1 Tax=Asticcacaulis sp. MM231 TaxID=3157666 RepID=UPI0032D58349
MARDFITLPPLYYRDHFLEMIGFVTSVYGAMLGEDEQAFISRFGELDEWAQCLYIRMVNRKKVVFSPGDLAYQEIGDLWGGLDQLREHGFIREICAQDYRACLDDRAKPDLHDLAKDHGLEVKSGWSKPKLADHLHAHLPYDTFASGFLRSDHLVPEHKDTLGFLLYLYFGRLSDNMTSFALRDLGVVSVKARDSYQARFDNLQSARAGYFYARQLRALKQGADARALADSIDQWPSAESEANQGLRDTLLHQIGLVFERGKDTARALDIYARSGAFESHERSVRLLYAMGATEEVKARLEAMLQSPAHDEEYIFASDFYARKFGQQRMGIFTHLLRSAETLEVDELFRGDAEYAAMQAYAKQGWTPWHSENDLWAVLFGLLFWEELFESAASFGSDFDYRPQSLKDRTFHTRFTDRIAQKLAWARAGEVADFVRDTIRRHHGESNGLFVWFKGLEDLITTFLNAAPRDAVAGLLQNMAEDFYGLRDGFPDLVLIRDDAVRFVEIKGEGDCVRRHQLARLNLLRGLGFAADICRVSYRTDPDQVYVVVDVETTGGRPPNDRVTEVGAVKVQHGRVIGEWSSLINPEKRIPQFITQLTGISNDMVRDAPKFADIADDFAMFIEGAIFVAHNATFDHGFIASEFRRLERCFRHPKLCTCASMRKHYPGHASYGLANLCRAFNIELKNHHRALADARAAAELLHLINEKRLEGLSYCA